jgi:hypothetical protein
VDWFNNRRLLEPIGGIPPAEAEARYYAQTEGATPWRRDSTQPASGKPGAVHSALIDLRAPQRIRAPNQRYVAHSSQPLDLTA